MAGTSAPSEVEVTPPEPTTSSGDESTPDEPSVDPQATTTKETDYMGRLLLTPGTNSKDYMGRATTATADYMGLLLLDA